ncbi:MAG: PspC domain-containing protein [Firmicutes bacterium]|nr:PspC domain-containing protein [Bacillota bacterium]
MAKRLYRSRKNVMIGGVAAGLAEYFDVDVSIMRLIWVIAALMGPGVLAYLVAWVIIPQEPLVPEYVDTEQVGDIWQAVDGSLFPEEKQRTVAIVLIGVGLALLARRIIPDFIIAWAWPLALIVIGAYLFYQRKERD